jgi:phosphohistidine phosphatase
VDLFIIRHADALALGERGITQDEDRPLSERGETQARVIGAGLRRRGVQLAHIVTSPLLRARQTAEEILRVWSPPLPEIHISPELAPGGKRKKLARFLEVLGDGPAALVGHQPDLSELTAWLIGSRRAQVDFAKAGVAHVACPDRPGKARGMLILLLTPEWLSDGK